MKALLALLALGVLAVTAYFLPLAEWTTVLVERTRGTGSVGVAIFMVAYVFSTIAFLPGSLLSLALGFTYGPLWGLAIASPASIAGSTAAFLLGRTVLHDWAIRRTRESAHARAISKAVEHEGFKIVLLLRLSPLVPFNLLNYVLSLTNLRLGTYVAASALGMLPGTALYVYLGSLAPTAAELSAAADGDSPGRTLLYILGLAATIVVTVIATRAARRALRSQLRGTT